jgi:hypothetical protein
MAGAPGSPSGGFFGIADYRYFGKRRISDRINDLFKPAGDIAIIGNFAALIANLGWYIFDDNDTVAHIGGKRGKAILRFALAHETGHFVSSRRILKSADHSAGFGMYALISHNSESPEPQTMCRHLPSPTGPKPGSLEMDSHLDSVQLSHHWSTRLPHHQCLYSAGKAGQGYGVSSVVFALCNNGQYPLWSYHKHSLKKERRPCRV